MSNRYDIAVVGGGLAGLSVLYHLANAGKLRGRRVVLIDPERKTGHDRTWSFWEREAGPFEALVYHRWDRVAICNGEKATTCVLAPYTYKLLRSTEFYAHVNERLDAVPEIERVYAKASELVPVAGGVRFRIDGRACFATHVFSSQPQPLDYREVREPYLDQHFRGWFVETEEDTFDPEVASLMDFRTPQRGETRFFYVLPFNKRRAMVEIAIFSNDHLTTEAYDTLIGDYIAAHWTTAPYTITHTEAGNIPMTTYPLTQREGNLIYLGLGGGAARPSTGYTFYGLQRQLLRLAQDFPNVNSVAPWPARHLLYDATLLRILQEGKLPGDEVFVDLFLHNPPARVLAFLNGESSVLEELQLMSTTNIGVFGRTFIGEVL